MTQLFVALKANAANVPIDNSGGSYTLSLTVADDSGVYNGANVAAGMKLLKLGDGGVAGQMKLYDITAVANVFSIQLDVTVNDVNTAGNPAFGDFAIVEPNAQGVFPFVAGVDPGLQQAMSQYNLTVLESIGGASLYSANGQLSGPREVDQNGNALNFKDGVQSVAIAAGKITTTDDIEVTGTGNGIIRTAADGTRWIDKKNIIGVTTSTKLP